MVEKGRGDGHVRRFVAVLVLCQWTLTAAGAEWSVEPRGRARTEVDTNKRLTTQEHDTAVGLIGEVGAVLSTRTELSEFSLFPRVEVSRYDGVDNYDSEDYLLHFGGRHQPTERVLLELEGDYNVDSTITSELDTTGQFQDRIRVNRLDVGPSVSYALTERDRVRLGGTYRDVDYDEVAGSNLVDFSFAGADVTYSRDLSERDQAFGTVRYSHFDAPDRPAATDSYSALAGYRREFTETMRGTASAGVIVSQANFVRAGMNESATSVGPLLNLDVEKEFERTVARGGYSLSVVPSGSGTQITRNLVDASLTHRFLERLEGRLSGRYLQVEAEEGTSTIADLDESNSRDYAATQAQLRYRLTEWWALSGGYGFRYQKYQRNRDSADSHQLFLNLTGSGYTFLGSW